MSALQYLLSHLNLILRLRSAVLADAGIVGFGPSELALDISGFKHNLGAGHFSLQSTANDLTLHFSAVPEPASLAVSLLFSLATLRHRRNS